MYDSELPPEEVMPILLGTGLSLGVRLLGSNRPMKAIYEAVTELLVSEEEEGRDGNS